MVGLNTPTRTPPSIPVDIPNLSRVADARRFFYTLFSSPTDGHLVLFAKRGDDKRSDAFTLSQIDQAAAKAILLADDGWDVYFSPGLQATAPVSPNRGLANGVTCMLGVWADIDVGKPDTPPMIEDGYNLVGDFPIPPTAVIRSGGGLHAYWFFKTPWLLADDADRDRARCFSDRFQDAFLAFAAQHGYTLDKTSPLNHVLRVPGTWNYKQSQPRPVTLLDNGGPRYDLADFDPLMEIAPDAAPTEAPQPQTPQGGAASSYQGNGSKWLAEAVDYGLGRKTHPSGKIKGRNDAGFWLACQLRNDGLSEFEAWPILAEFQALVGDDKDHSYTEAEARDNLRSAYRGERRPRAERQGIKTSVSANGHSADPKNDPKNYQQPAFDGVVERPAPEPERDPWRPFTLADAYAPRPPREYIVAGLFRLPSLNIVYGAPGCLKTTLLMDLAASVVSACPWLTPLPGQPGTGRATKPYPVMWVDFDMGEDDTHERFEAVARARNLPLDAPLTYYSMPSPWLDAGNAAHMVALQERIEASGAKLIILDNLGAIRGDVDENSAEMGTLMSHFRRLAEATRSAVVLIHHQRKSNGVTNNRAGDTLRGHSSIEAALNLALLIEREDRASIVTGRATKVRGVDVDPFTAQFAYSHKPDTTDLESLKFFSLAVEDTTGDKAIDRVIANCISASGRRNQKQLVADVKKELPDVGEKRIRGRADVLVSQGKLRVAPGAFNAREYTPL